MLWLESLFWHHCNNRFSNLDTVDLDYYLEGITASTTDTNWLPAHPQQPLVSQEQLSYPCVLKSNYLSVVPVNYILLSIQCCQSGVLTLRDPRGKIKLHESQQILGTTWPWRPTYQSNWNHIFALTPGFFLSVFVLQLSITLCNMTHSALKTIPQAHQGFIFFCCWSYRLQAWRRVVAALLFSFCKVGNGVIYHLSNVRKVRINQMDCVSRFHPKVQLINWSTWRYMEPGSCVNQCCCWYRLNWEQYTTRK